MISPLAYIHPEAQIGENVEIGPFVFIDKNVIIGDNNVIMPNVNILYGSRIGNGNRIFPGAVIGAIPQDLKFKGEETTAEVGDNNTIRENVTINRGTAAKWKTVVGSNNLLMEGVHVAHDAIIGNGCIIGNATKLAGEVIVPVSSQVCTNLKQSFTLYAPPTSRPTGIPAFMHSIAMGMWDSQSVEMITASTSLSFNISWKSVVAFG